MHTLVDIVFRKHCSVLFTESIRVGWLVAFAFPFAFSSSLLHFSLFILLFFSLEFFWSSRTCLIVSARDERKLWWGRFGGGLFRTWHMMPFGRSWMS
mmetsp:Transcript_10933/g.21843  ORF Transcript_10933/g.21843 Transcript_10933/m.21843 type:complete len:97 (-) Transcript_10933:770-1060(-)